METTRSAPPSLPLGDLTLIAPTTLIFLLIVGALASLGLFSPGWFGFFVAAVGVVGLHSMLDEPRRLIRRYGMQPLHAHDSHWAAILSELAASMKVYNLQPLWVDHPKIVEPFVFGTFRRHYLALPKSFIQATDLPIEEKTGVIYHELAHIRAGDTWMSNLSQKFAGAFLAATLFWHVLMPVYTLIWASLDRPGFAQALASSPFRATIDYAQRVSPIPTKGFDAETNVFSEAYNSTVAWMKSTLSSWGMIHLLITQILSVAFLMLAARSLFRVREFYADVTAAAAQGTSSFLRHFFARMAARQYFRSSGSLPLGVGGDVPVRLI